MMRLATRRWDVDGGGNWPERVRLSLMTCLLVSFTINLLAYMVDRASFLALWQPLSPRGQITSLDTFTFRLMTAHLIAIAYLWFFAGATGWQRVRNCFKMLKAEPVYGAVFIICLIIFPVHVLEARGVGWAHMLIVEDGPLEDATTWFSLMASALFLYAATQKPGMSTLRGCLLAAAVFFLFGMEEISWGQRIFGLHSPQFVAEYNYQDETNVHNFFNPELRPVMLTFFLILAALLFYCRDVDRFVEKRLGVSFGMDEADSLFFIIFLAILPWTVQHAEELGEEYFSLFGLAFILRRVVALVRSRRRKWAPKRGQQPYL